MKNLLIAFAAFLLLSCVLPPTKIPRVSIFTGIDFRKYTESGFLFTPEKYSGEYESIGIVNYKLMPAAEFVSSYGDQDPTYNGPNSKRWVTEEIYLGQVIDSLYVMAKEMGADAIMNFEVIYEEESRADVYGLKLEGWTARGFAIKRKQVTKY